MLKRILHTGMEVESLERAIKLYESLGFNIYNRFEKPEPKAQVALLQNGEAMYELWEFNDKTHPQVRFIRNHVAILSDSLEEDINKFIKQGYKLVIPLTEGVTLRYAFVQDATGSNYEIASEKKQ